MSDTDKLLALVQRWRAWAASNAAVLGDGHDECKSASIAISYCADELERALAQPANDKSVRLVRFIGINPLEIGAGATEPMLRDSWRFAFSEGDDGVLRFSFNDNGSLVATAATAQPAEAVEGEQAIYGMFRAIVEAGGPETIARHGVERGSDQWVSKVRAGMLAIEWRHHPERFDEPPTDAAHGAVDLSDECQEFVNMVGDEFGNDAGVRLRNLFERLTHPQAAPAQGDGWRLCYSAVIHALAAIVNIRCPDKLFDLDAIPRGPVMDQVVLIREAMDRFGKELAAAPSPEPGS